MNNTSELELIHKNPSHKQIVNMFFNKLIDEYGYSSEQIEIQNILDNNNEPDITKIDILIWRNVAEKKQNKKPIIAINCTQNPYLKSKEYLEVENYALLEGVKFFATYNPYQKERVFKFSEKYPPLQIEELDTLPSATVIEDKEAIDAILAKTKKIDKETFRKLFFACHDIIRNNDKLSPEMAFDEISKILFIKISFEKEYNTIFGKSFFEKLNTTPQKIFEEIKIKYKGDRIFEEIDKLRIRDITFSQIIEKLSEYNLADIEEDIKGSAFEEFLGRTFRGNLGQFFTPREIVDFMVEVLEPHEGETICDPCCGSGGFLIKSFGFIKDQIKNDITHQKDKIRQKLKGKGYHKLPDEEKNQINEKLLSIFREIDQDFDSQKEGSRLNKLSKNCIFGVDAEPRSARTAKMNMIMQGDGHSGVHHHDGLLNVNGIFEERFDVIITNPPFGAKISKDLLLQEEDIYFKSEEINDNLNKYGETWQDAYDTTKEKYNYLKRKNKKNNNVKLLSFFDVKSSLTEALFVERCLKLLRKGGRMGIVLPEGFLNGSTLQKVRDYVEGKAKILLIVSIPQDVFISVGASVKSSLVFLKRFTEEEEEEYNKIKEEVGDSEEKVKKRFNYKIPIVEIKKAGISSIGQKIENELEPTQKEFKIYQKQVKIWEGNTVKFTYELDSNGELKIKQKFQNF